MWLSLQHFFCSLFSFLLLFVFWGYWTTRAQLHIYDRSSAPTWRIKVKSIYLMLKFLWFFLPFVYPFTGVHFFLLFEIIYFDVSRLVLALCILHGLSICLVLAFSSSINPLLPLLSSSNSSSLLFVWSVPELCCLLCLAVNELNQHGFSASSLPVSPTAPFLLPKPSPSTFGFLSTLVFPALTCNMSVKFPSIYSSLDVMNNKEQYMERCIYGWAEGPMS